MKHLGADWRVYQNDRLVIRYINGNTRKRLSQGKRVGKDCPLTQEERRIYIQKGIVATVLHVKERLALTLSDAMTLVKRARGDKE